jgi:hypothetical protein
MMMNVPSLAGGREWFDRVAGKYCMEDEAVSLILHELAHHRASNHLSDDYHRALSDFGAKMRWAISCENDD